MKINYSLRQQKSIERKMFCHLLRELNHVFKMHKYRYIGMGAKYFTDFILFHKEFGFKKMISIEADLKNKVKYNFNKPLKCIDMEYNFSSDALHNIDWAEYSDNIIWLDYDSYLSDFMMEDVQTMISKLISGGMFFISFNSQLPRMPSEKEEVFRKNMKNYCPARLERSHLADTRKDAFFKNIINNIIITSLKQRNLSYPIEEQLNFQQLIYFTYKDGAEMTTIGGILLNNNDQQKFNDLHIDTILDYLRLNIEAPPYSLIVPPLTYKELNILLRQLPTGNISSVKIPGLSQEQIESVVKLYRYYPLYLEAETFN